MWVQQKLFLSPAFYEYIFQFEIFGTTYFFSKPIQLLIFRFSDKNVITLSSLEKINVIYLFCRV